MKRLRGKVSMSKRNEKEECLFPSLMSRLDKMSELAAILLLAETCRIEGGKKKKNSSLLDDVAEGLYRTNFNSLFLNYTTCTIPSFTL